MDQKPPLHVLLAGPRGCCAGVDRAMQVVEEALRRYGAPSMSATRSCTTAPWWSG